MRDFSINLPSWSLHLGYTLKGLSGTYDDLELKKDGKFVQKFFWDSIPNIFEMEEILIGLENKETK